MATGTSSKVAYMSSSLNSSDPLDSSDLMEQESRRYSSSDDRPRPSLFFQVIIHLSFFRHLVASYILFRGQSGAHKIEIFQNGLRSLNLSNYRSAADIA